MNWKHGVVIVAIVVAFLLGKFGLPFTNKTEVGEQIEEQTLAEKMGPFDSPTGAGWLATERDLRAEGSEVIYVHSSELNKVTGKTYITCVVYPLRRGTPRRYFELPKEYSEGYYVLEGTKLVERAFDKPPTGFE